MGGGSIGSPGRIVGPHGGRALCGSGGWVTSRPAIERGGVLVVTPHAVPQPKGRWIEHLNTQLSSVESTLDVIADFSVRSNVTPNAS